MALRELRLWRRLPEVGALERRVADLHRVAFDIMRRPESDRAR